MALEEDQVTPGGVVETAEEVIERHLIERGRRGIRRNVAADAGAHAVGPHDHRHSVPAQDAFDPPLDVAVAGVDWLLVDRDRVHIRRVGRERQIDPLTIGDLVENREQVLHPLGPLGVEHVLQRFEPFARLGRVDIHAGADDVGLRVRTGGAFFNAHVARPCGISGADCLAGAAVVARGPATSGRKRLSSSGREPPSSGR